MYKPIPPAPNNADHRSVANVVLKHEHELTQEMIAVLGNHDVFGDARARHAHGLPASNGAFLMPSIDSNCNLPR